MMDESTYYHKICIFGQLVFLIWLFVLHTYRENLLHLYAIKGVNILDEGVYKKIQF